MGYDTPNIGCLASLYAPELCGASCVGNLSGYCADDGCALRIYRGIKEQEHG